MEGISRVDLDRISQILSNYVNTEEAIKLADKLTKFDAIPKLYVYTYFKKIYQEMEKFKIGSKDNKFDDFVKFSENLPMLGMQGLQTLEDTRRVFEILHNGFEREKDVFCDFDDSRFHGQRKWGKCECQDHEGSKKIWLTPTYDGSEELGKYIDEPFWWCDDCCNIDRDYDCDYAVSCDMDMEE